MDLIARILGSQRGLFAVSSVVAVITGVAIIGFGAPPVILVVVAYGESLLVGASSGWVRRRLGRG
jgi:hypothetical protein